jgi:hypothetical protein
MRRASDTQRDRLSDCLGTHAGIASGVHHLDFRSYFFCDDLAAAD